MSDLLNPPVQVPPYLSKVSIHDHAPLRKVSVGFKRGLNIIIGPNGSGKTRFLTLLSELADLREKRRHFQGAGCELVFGGVFSEKSRVTIGYEEYDNTQPEGEVLNWDVLGWETPGIELSAKYWDSLREGQIIEDFLGDYPPVFIAHGTPSTDLPILDEAADIVLEKRAVTVQLKDGVYRLDELRSRFSQVVIRSIIGALRNGFTVLNGVPVPPPTAEVARQRVVTLLQAFTEHLNKVLPVYSPAQAVRSSEYFQVYYQSAQDQYTIKGLALEYLVAGSWLSFRMLSDGTKRLVYAIAELFAPEVVGLNKETLQATVRSPQARIVLLEEPELGVHLDQLQKFLLLLRDVARQNQVILTTHSPQVLDMLSKSELDRITICELDSRKGTQFRKLTATKKAKAKAYMQHDSYLSDFWRFSNLEEAG